MVTTTVTLVARRRSDKTTMIDGDNSNGTSYLYKLFLTTQNHER